MSLFEHIGIDEGYIIIGAVVAILVLLILIIILMVKQSKLNKKYNSFMSGTDGKSLEEEFLNKFKEIDRLKLESGKVKDRLNLIEETLVTTYQKMAIVKYDAFKEMGGKLSFALALLNDNNDGFVINAMHSSREGCYTYVKEIIKGESFVLLAEEEKQAVEEAIKSKNFME